MQRMRKFLHTAVIFSMLMTLVAVAFPATVGAANLSINPQSFDFDAVEVGTTSIAQEFSITNAGNLIENINDVYMTAGGTWFDVTANGCLDAFLLPGQSCVFSVVFEPDFLGDVQGTVQIEVGGGEPDSFVTVSGSGVTPMVSYVPAAPFDFGDVQVGETSAQQVITVTNNGSEEIQFVFPTISTGDPDFQVDTTSPLACVLNFELSPGASCTVRVTVTPSEAGPQNGAIALFYIVNPNAPGPTPDFVTTSYALSANGVFAEVTVAPNPVNFGNQLLGTESAPQAITITNTGVGPVNIQTTTIGGSDPTQFVEIEIASNCELATLLPGESCTEWVLFAPTGVAGPRDATFRISIDNSLGQYPPAIHDVLLTGTATTINSNVAPAFHNFGSRQVGTVSAPQTFTYTNNSAGGIQLGTVAIDPAAGYLIQNDLCTNGFVAAGGTCTFQVLFAPTTTGVHNAAIEIDGVAVAQITGIGVLANISVTPNPVNFPNTEVGSESPAQVVTITNNGPESVDILAVFEASIHYDEDGSNCEGQTLTAGQSCTINVVFTPQTTGSLSRTLFIVLDRGAGVEFFTVGMLGIGTPAALDITEPDGTNDGVFDFGDVVIGQTAQAIFVVTNNSGAPITLPAAGGVITPGGGPFSEASDTCDGGTTLNPGDSCSIIVSFTPTAVGPAVGLLTVNPMVQLLGNGVSPNGALVVNTPQLTFGPQQVGSQSTTQQVIVSNNGNEPVEITSIAAAPNDYVPTAGAGANCQVGLVLDPGTSCVIWLAFQPDGTPMGDVNGSLTIGYTSLAVPAGNLIVLLRGTAISPVVTVSPSQLNFGNVQVNSVSAPQTVTLTNSTNGPVTLDLSGPYTGDFELVGELCDDATLAPGESCTFQITFRPQSTGTQTDAVDIDVEPGAIDYEVDLVGVGISPVVAISPSQLDFGTQEINTTSAPQTVTVTNSTNGPIDLDLSGPFGPHFEVVAELCDDATLAAGESCTFQVVFHPTSAGTKSAAVDIDVEPGAIDFEVDLKGIGIDPTISVTPTGPVDFGTVVADGPGGSFALMAFTVTNNGSNPVEIPAPVITGHGYGVQANDCPVGPAELGPGASCTIIVYFDPTDPGVHNGTFMVNPIVLLVGNAVSVNGALSVSPPQLSFGPQQIDTQSQTQQVIVSNNGNIPVEIDGVTVPADYVLVNGAGNTCQTGAILDPGQSCAFWVAFQPSGPPGPKNGQIDITYNSAAIPAGTVSVLVRGNAITPNGTVSPLQLDFGFQEVGVMSGVQTVTFTNTGTDIIVIPPVSVTPAGEFHIQSDSCSGASVLPGATCTISVYFLPTVAGSHEAELTVGALPNQAVVSLKGVGVDATISVDPLNWDFGAVVIGQTAIKAFTVTNNGSDPVMIPAAAFNGGGGAFVQLSEDCSTMSPLGPGASCTIVVQFAPTAVQPYNGTMTVNPIVTLHGTGIAPSGALSVSPVQLTFGNVQVNSMSPTQTITFSNNGSLPVILDSLPALAGPHAADFLLTIAGNTCQIGVALNPGESCVVSVAFRPTFTGPREAWVNLTYHSASVANGVVSVLLRGVGITPVISVSPNQLVFGNQTLNTASAAKTVTITNSSNGPLTLLTLGTGGTNPTDFQIVGDLCSGATLAAGTTCQFSVIFLPTSSPGPKNATVIIPVQGLGNVTVALSGQALAAQQGGLTFSPAFQDFGFVQVGSPTAPRPVTITNNGTAVVTINDIDMIGPGFLDFFPLIADDCEGKQLNPGQSCTVWVRFRPLDTGLSEVALTYFTDLAGSPHAVYLYGVGITPVLAISPVQLNYGSLQVGSVSAPYAVTVTNNSTGHINLDLDGPYTGDFELVGQLCDDATLAPGGSCTFYVTFRPQSLGTQTDAVDIDITPGGLDFEVDLVGVGVTPNGYINPLQLDFGNVQVGTTSTVQTVTFTNTGTGPIFVPEVNLAGPNPGDFLIQTDSCSNAVLTPGQWCQVSVVARPQVQGPRNAQLSIAPLHNPDVVTLKVNGQVPSPAFDAAAVDFGLQPLNVESTPRRVTVTNIGQGDLILFGQITSASIMGPDAADFHVKVSTCNDITLAPGQSCYVDLTFKPLPPLGPDPDIRTAWLEFVTNMPTAVQTVPLTGQVGQFEVDVVVGVNPCLDVTLSPAGPYAGSDEVSATATVSASDIFIGWYLDGYYVGFSNPIDFKMKDSSHQLEAICVPRPTFSDIAGSAYINEIEQMAAHGFIKGYFGLSGPYGPNDDVLRSQMAVIISRMAERTNGWNSETPPNPFIDQCNIDGCVDPESWNAVAVGFSKQVIRGVGFGQFAPFQPVTEIQVVAFTSRTLISVTAELELRGRYPACPDAPIPAPPVGVVSPCPTPPNVLTGQEGSYPATKWEEQLDNVTIFGDVHSGSGHRKDISTYNYYVGNVPGPNGTTIGPATSWPTWTTAAEREQVAAIMWWAFADYWGVDRIDEVP